jgi:hypothetical protein
MPSVNDYPARGKVVAVSPDSVTFAPTGTNYRFHLSTGGVVYTGSRDVPVACFIRVEGRKLWTVPSGGGFVSPIFGSPRTIQGRVKFIGDREMVVTAGTNFIVSLPAGDHAYGLATGEVTVGALVNVMALPGARFELVPAPVATIAG